MDGIQEMVEPQNLWIIRVASHRDGNALSKNRNNLSSHKRPQEDSLLLDSERNRFKPKLKHGCRYDIRRYFD